MILDAGVETLDWVHRLYEASEAIDILVLLTSGKLFYSFFLVQVILGIIIPLWLLCDALIFQKSLSEKRCQWMYLISSLLILIGVFAMRWNVVIGGQLFSKSLRGFTAYKVGLAGQEGLITGMILMILPFIILGVFIKLFLPREEME